MIRTKTTQNVTDMKNDEVKILPRYLCSGRGTYLFGPLPLAAARVNRLLVVVDPALDDEVALFDGAGAAELEVVPGRLVGIEDVAVFLNKRRQIKTNYYNQS